MQKTTRRPLYVFFAVVVVFLLPIIIAWCLLTYGHHSGFHTTNRGRLVRPPLPIQSLVITDIKNQPVPHKAFLGKWMLLYVHPEKTCERACIQQLYDFRQIRLALGKHMDRVRRAVLVFPAGKDDVSTVVRRRYPGTHVLVTTREQFSVFSKSLPSRPVALKTGHIYLVDPKGFLMMSYPLTTKRGGIYKDLNHLLKNS